MRAARGFTLLELLVALAVFSVMAAIAYSGLDGLVRSRAHLADATDRLRALQLSVDTVRRDVAQTVLRPVRDGLGGTRPAIGAFPGRFELEMTRGGWTNPLDRPRSHLRRIAYHFEGDALVRYSANVLDGAQRGAVERRVLITGLRGMEVRLLDGAGEWHSDWPAAAGSQAPVAVSLELELEDWGRVRRVFPLEVTDTAPVPPVPGAEPS